MWDLWKNKLKKIAFELKAPVVFIIFNRFDTAERVFNAIAQAKPKNCSSLRTDRVQTNPEKRKNAHEFVRLSKKSIGRVRFIKIFRI